MKKIIFTLILCLGLINTLSASYAAEDPVKIRAKERKAEIKAQRIQARAERKAQKAEIKALKKTYKKITKDVPIMRALELMKNSPASGAYEKITGNNPTLNPMKIKYKNLGEIKAEYRNYNAMPDIKRKEITINVNSKHKNAPYEAQSAVLAGMTSFVDKKESVNELVYSKTLEAFLWNYYLKKNPDLAKDKSPLTISENRNLKLYKAYPRNSKEIQKVVRKQRPDIKYVWESTGYTHREYTEKMRKVYEAYEATEAAYKKQNTVKYVPVLDLKEDNTAEVINTNPEKEYIKEHLRGDVKANPEIEEHFIHQASYENQGRCEICGCPIEGTAPAPNYENYEDEEY